LILSLLVALSAPHVASAQGFRLSGHVSHVTPEDSVDLSARAVVLHFVTEASGGVVDSTLTDGHGQYSFVVTTPDTTAEYYVSVEHDDIGYFSNALHLASRGSDTVRSIAVYDTSYAEPAIVLQERHIILRSPDADGTRRVIELISLHNGGHFTRISADTSRPVWQGLLPLGAFQLDVGDSEVGVGAIYSRGNSLAVAAPLPPGEKQVLFSYIVPRAGEQLEFPVDQPIARLTISIEDTTATATGRALALYGIETVGESLFKRYDAENVPAGIPVVVHFETPFVSIERLQLIVVLGAILVLAGTLAWWMRRNRAPNAA